MWLDVDDPYGRRLADELRGRRAELLTFSAGAADADFSPREVSFDATAVELPLPHACRRGGGADAAPGHFNVANALGALAAADALGVDLGDGRRGAGRAARVPGRFEPIDEGQAFARPGRLRPHARLARERAAGGAAADRGPADLGLRRRRRPRPRQAAADGRAAGAELSDLAIVTSDNPRSEDPEAIIAEIVAGIEDGAGGRGRARPPRRDRAGARRAPAGRHRRDRRQGPRAGPGVRGRPEDPLRRPRGRPRGAAEAGRERRGDRRSTPERDRRGDRRRGRRRGGDGAPRRATIDSREARRGRPLLRPARRARRRRRVRPAAIEAGAWGVVVERSRRASLRPSERSRAAAGSSPSTTRSRRCRRSPRAWRRELGARVVGVTGSVGKTSVKDIARALLPGRVHANRENLNTEIGLPLTVLEAPDDTEVAGPGDGDARAGPDRRAGRDRRAGGRR